MPSKFIQKGLLRETSLAIFLTYVVFFFIFYYHRPGLDASYKSVFFFILNAAAPLISITTFVHAAPLTVAFVLAVGIVVVKTSGWLRIGLLWAAFASWEFYGGYCVSFFT